MSNQKHFKFDSILNFFLSHHKNHRAIGMLHGHLLRTGLLFISLNIHTKLIFTCTTYNNGDDHQTLTKLFKFMNLTNPLPFNVIISDFCRNGFASLAIQTFDFMHFNGVFIDSYALCCALTSSSSIKGVEFGKQVHGLVVKLGFRSSVFVSSALVDFYAKSSILDDAVKVFDESPVRNTVCANALLSGFAEAKFWSEGLELFRKMPVLKLDYDYFSFSAVLRLCVGLFVVELGKQVHANLIRKIVDFETDVFLQSSLIEMYGKCGLVVKARKVFDLEGFERRAKRKKDVVLWTSMLGVYGRNGNFKQVIELYKEMLIEGVTPDGVVFVTVISACGHTGQVKLGLESFESMVLDFGLNPGPEHYSCVVDLLCRAGELEKAWRLVNDLSCEGDGNCSISINITLWGALLSACVDWGNVDLGKLAARKALELDPKNVGICVLLSNLYAKFGMWDEIAKLRKSMNEGGLKKDIGHSLMEVTNSIHSSL